MGKIEGNNIFGDNQFKDQEFNLSERAAVFKPREALAGFLSHIDPAFLPDQDIETLERLLLIAEQDSLDRTKHNERIDPNRIIDHVLRKVASLDVVESEDEQLILRTRAKEVLKAGRGSYLIDRLSPKGLADLIEAHRQQLDPTPQLSQFILVGLGVLPSGQTFENFLRLQIGDAPTEQMTGSRDQYLSTAGQIIMKKSTSPSTAPPAHSRALLHSPYLPPWAEVRVGFEALYNPDKEANKLRAVNIDEVALRLDALHTNFRNLSTGVVADRLSKSLEGDNQLDDATRKLLAVKIANLRAYNNLPWQNLGRFHLLELSGGETFSPLKNRPGLGNQISAAARWAILDEMGISGSAQTVLDSTSEPGSAELPSYQLLGNKARVSLVIPRENPKDDFGILVQIG